MSTHRLLPLTDTHCHLDQYPDDAPGLTDEDLEHTRVIGMSLSPDDFFDVQKKNPYPQAVFPALGLFPTPERLTDYTLDQMLDHIPEVKFIGEIGLDYVSDDLAFRRRQQTAFDRILEKAAERQGTVLSIHSRRAAKDVVDRLKDGFPGFPILHWFSGPEAIIDQAKDTCYFSINTAMVHSEEGRKRIRAIPEDRLLLETDGPYVLKEDIPARPRDLVDVIHFFSGEWGCSMEETSERFEARADRLFG